MVLTQQRRTSTSEDEFPTAQLFLLAICRIAEPIALTSIFPYSWVMVKDFNVADDNNASFYAGILVSTFSLCEALTGMFWGSLSDRVGRKPVLISGCFGTMASLLMVGFATNFWVALLGRALGGVLNGNIGVIQTMVGELVKNPEHEPRAYAIMPFFWSIGTIIGPAIGGLLAKPAEGYPTFFSQNGLFGIFPFLLPNLVCSALLLCSIMFCWLLLKETHPDMQPRNGVGAEGPDSTSAIHPLLATSGPSTTAGADLRAESYGTFNHVHLHEDQDWHVRSDGSIDSSSQRKAVFTWQVTMLVLALAIFTYHSMTYDHLLPIFLQDKRAVDVNSLTTPALRFPGGVGLSTQSVGLIMSCDGLIALFIQSLVFPVLAHYLGVWRLFVFVTIMHPLAYFMVPFLIYVPQDFIFTGIFGCLAVRNVLSIIDYPVLLILIKQVSPSGSVLGKINGLAASAGALSRTLAPPIAGFLYSTGVRMQCTALAWWGSTLVAIIGAVQMCLIQQKKHSSVVVRPAAHCRYAPDASTWKQEAVHIIVTEAEADIGHQTERNLRMVEETHNSA
ncbi:permease of the major facilitator superfamily [Aspergillus japonicus CBS 114.51]|uniref:Permease of the major facilitator superfamily n=1 Tax=Aspergillus japonicus CBS 114.51 TaxID=1448312 RepID=A0A8T8WLX5_ASPJA|nr:permease of the major facilitator superfamily [Aspergillus japonicus CBS 114.51]RAH76409.1 permease of the major facilitator superfamily [Aspergillus japonicus CBS 114.51]